MSAIIDRIESEYKVAFKAHHQVKVNMLRMVKSALENAEIEARRDLRDDEVLTVLQREAKKRREAIALYQQGGRPDKAAAEQAELNELLHFLPAQIADDQLEAIIRETIAALAAKPPDAGRVVGAVMKKVQGQADGSRVAAAVKKLLT